MAQSESLADETAVMRRFDGALQAASHLPAKTYARVLRYVAERVADELQASAAQLPAGNGATRIDAGAND